mmetsp:Transcript_99477/g.297200  ORF Transcript_99477/g.297200 Transcript_99477/m.297200 type:complete len:222 (+) Transcript_99477:21-686(+)
MAARPRQREAASLVTAAPHPRTAAFPRPVAARSRPRSAPAKGTAAPPTATAVPTRATTALLQPSARSVPWAAAPLQATVTPRWPSARPAPPRAASFQLMAAPCQLAALQLLSTAAPPQQTAVQTQQMADPSRTRPVQGSSGPGRAHRAPNFPGRSPTMTNVRVPMQIVGRQDRRGRRWKTYSTPQRMKEPSTRAACCCSTAPAVLPRQLRGHRGSQSGRRR